MTKPRKTSASDADDARLFRESVRGVKPLRTPARVEYRRPRPKPVPLNRLRDEQEALRDSLSDHIPWDVGLETGEELKFVRPGLGLQTLRQLRRGHWVTQEQLDLHGLTVLEAREMLVAFLNECRQHDARCVRIIHGKGLRSKNREPVLRNKVASWLMQRDEVLAFCQARRADGGSGAVVVLLKAARRAPRSQ